MRFLKKFSLLLLILVFSYPTSIYALNTEKIPLNKELNWYIVNRNNKETPEILKGIDEHLKETNSFFVGDTLKKELYLTFDEGYENGNTEAILDVLKTNNVKAAFFVVKSYIKSNPEIVKRMVNEGHLVCNHSVTHKSMATILDNNSFNQEFLETEEAFKELISKDMPKYFRPPMGKYSINSLAKTKELGYKTIFWSFAYQDWLVDKQPNPDIALNKIKSGVHNGAILLLHAVSKTNTEILGTLIKDMQNEGYEFKSLDELPPSMILTGDATLKNTLNKVE